ncbi:hypothetical protein AB6A40_007703 [Gnathostoma spinigerum]|uniref:Peptidase M1 membrane alanine aminopeptidase domain-containing protein n=1 Tax=Gnathostoma spinigerum TaxID=75299 RepID=A0ABD6ES51_9BILA
MDAEPYRTHPIYDGEGAKFDSIVYKKGASILKMIRATLGPDTFQLALQNYLKKHEYGTATHQMLFDEFTEAARQNRITDWCGEPFNATKFLEPWFLQSDVAFNTSPDLPM